MVTHKSIFLPFLWLTALLATSGLWANEISLSSNTTLSNEGYFVLRWQVQDKTAFATNDNVSLSQADNPQMQNARIRHTLPLEGAITLSGFADGDYYFRINSATVSSEVLKIEVKHHGLTKAFGFFITGLILFCILLACIFIGHRIHQGKTP